MSKDDHLILVKSTFKAINITNIFMKEIFRLNDIPKVVISNKDATFTRMFWQAYSKEYILN